MEKVLTIAIILGGLLFIYSFIKYAITGFHYHPITGLLALIPVLNIITLPTLMDGKIIRLIIFGLFGLLLAIAAWFLGGDKSLYKHISIFRGQPVLISNESQAENKQKTMMPNTNTTASANQATSSPDNSSTEDSNEQPNAPKPIHLMNLPKQALYNMQFIDAPVDKISTLTGRIVRIVTRENSVIEGRLEKATNSSIFVAKTGDGNVAYEMLVSNIKKITVLIKRSQ